jgi:carbon monoxide dehydrogenase subunit G
MPRITETIHIERSPEEVHRFIFDPENTLLWQTNLIDYELLADKPEKGAQVRCVSKVAGRRLEYEMEYAELDVGQRTLLRSTKAPLEFSVEQTFEPAGNGTTLTYQVDVKSLGGFFGKLSDPVVTRLFGRDVRSNLENLKELVEAA